MARQPTLLVDDCMGRFGWCVRVRDLDRNLVGFFRMHPQTARLLQSILRVRVAEAEMQGDEDLPDVLGHHHVLEGEVRFIPHFPFEPGVRYRASFDLRPLGRPEHSEALTLEFSRPTQISAKATQVTNVFPSAEVLPENLLRFYVCFSNSMQRGRAEEQIRLLGPDGRPVPDALYRPPCELWDRSMQHLTILLDPGRLKRWVGPNRVLGAPLKAGQRYTLEIGPGMVDLAGRSSGLGFYKQFLVTEAVRHRIGVAQWKILPPATKSQEPLAIVFSEPLDWGLLWRAITVTPEGGPPMNGQIVIDQGERRWRFTPTSPWVAGSYSVRVDSSIEDVCGNGLLAPFDRPLRSGSNLAIEMANCSIRFQLPHR